MTSDTSDIRRLIEGEAWGELARVIRRRGLRLDAPLDAPVDYALARCSAFDGFNPRISRRPFFMLPEDNPCRDRDADRLEGAELLIAIELALTFLDGSDRVGMGLTVFGDRKIGPMAQVAERMTVAVLPYRVGDVDLWERHIHGTLNMMRELFLRGCSHRGDAMMFTRRVSSHVLPLYNDSPQVQMCPCGMRETLRMGAHGASADDFTRNMTTVVFERRPYTEETDEETSLQPSA